MPERRGVRRRLRLVRCGATVPAMRRDLLLVASLCYLLLPNVIFAAGWLKLPVAALVVAALVAAVADAWRRAVVAAAAGVPRIAPAAAAAGASCAPPAAANGASCTAPTAVAKTPCTAPVADVPGGADPSDAAPSDAAQGDPRRALATAALVVALAAFWTVAAGIGELHVQVYDYDKHNLVFHDLAVMPWPVVYDVPGSGPALLCYYVGYYLPAALAAKAAGLHAAAPASLLWGFAGVLLAFAWVVRLGRPHGGTVLALFTLVDGYAWVPGLLRLVERVMPAAAGAGTPWWHVPTAGYGFWTFGSSGHGLLAQPQVLNLVWAPQHTLAAWIATACVLSCLVEGAAPRYLLLVGGATVLWSPFVTIGLLPLAALAVLRDRRRALSWPGLVGGAAAAAPVALLFLDHVPIRETMWFPSVLEGPGDWLKLAAFHLALTGVLWAALAAMRRRHGIPDGRWWRAVTVAAAVVPLASVLSFGHYNDWFLRVPGPSMTALHLGAAVALAEVWRRAVPRRRRLAFTLLVVLSMARPLRVYVLAPTGGLPANPARAGIAHADAVAASLAALPRTEAFDFAGQYLGRADGAFARLLMRGGPAQ
jgi:hypothetical protein